MKKIMVIAAFLVAHVVSVGQSLEQGKDFLLHERYNSAIDFFTKFLNQHPEHGEAWLLLMKAYANNRDPRMLTDTIRKATSVPVDDPFFLVARGLVYMYNDKRDSARLVFEEAINQVKGKDPQILGYVAETNAYHPKGDYNWAIELANKAVKNKRAKDDPWFSHIIGKSYHQLHNGGEAFRAYTLATEKSASFAPAYYELGQIFKSQSNPGMYVDYFSKAVKADAKYGPAHYELYRHFLYRDPAVAMTHFKNYQDNADYSPENEYAYVDLLYLTKQYNEAIELGKKLMPRSESPARIYKLVAYSYSELKDTVTAMSYLRQYFEKAPDSVVIARDYETMGDFYISAAIAEPNKAIEQYKMAVDASDDSTRLVSYYRKLATLFKSSQDYNQQAYWSGKYYTHSETAGNIDLFNWGIAAYRAQDYSLSDSVFGLYVTKYPAQGFGYYWRAKSKAAIDSTMEQGLAAPVYLQLIDVLKSDSLSTTNKSWLKEAYGYLAAFEANTRKNYDQAIEYFEQILEIEPENETAKNYIKLLETNLQKETDTN